MIHSIIHKTYIWCKFIYEPHHKKTCILKCENKKALIRCVLTCWSTQFLKFNIFFQYPNTPRLKRDISNNNSFESARRTSASWRHFYCKMTSVMALDGVTSFLRWKDVTHTCKYMWHNPNIGGISSVQWRKVGRSWRLQMYFRRSLCVKIKIDQVCYVHKNLLFVGQLYEDKSLVLCAHDLILFITDLQTVAYFSTVNC